MMKRVCDWCRQDVVFSYMLPVPAGAVEPEDYIHIDFCAAGVCTDNAVQHLARTTAGRPYPTEVHFSVVNA
jgi:hypothetical protein